MKTLPTISMVLPTVGRTHLFNTLISAREAGLGEGDELIVVMDGPFEPTRHVPVFSAMEDWPGDLLVVHLKEGEGGNYGHPGRTYGQSRATRDLVMFTQDDQRFTPGAIQRVRQAVSETPRWHRKAHIFPVVPRAGNIVPQRDGDLELGHIDADCVVLPTKQRRLFGEWDPKRLGYNGDHAFIERTFIDFTTKALGMIWHLEGPPLSVQEMLVPHYSEFFR